MAHPLWFRIIKDDHRNNQGPTFPYVVGAIRVDPNAPPADGHAELKILLQKMDGETPKGFGLKIQGCGNKVAAHIVKVVDGGSGLDWSGVSG